MFDGRFDATKNLGEIQDRILDGKFGGMLDGTFDGICEEMSDGVLNEMLDGRPDGAVDQACRRILDATSQQYSEALHTEAPQGVGEKTAIGPPAARTHKYARAHADTRTRTHARGAHE